MKGGFFIWGFAFALGFFHSSIYCQSQPKNLSALSSACDQLDSTKCYKSEIFPPITFGIEQKFESAAITTVYHTPLLADMNGDCIPDIIMAGTTNSLSNPRLTSGIRIINTKDGSIIRSFNTAMFAWSSPTSFAIADVDLDGIPEIILAAADHNSNAANLRGKLICYNADGTVRWISNQQFGANAPIKYGGTPGFADFNQDGIPEVYIYNEIFNAQTGNLLCQGGANGMGISFSNPLYGSVSTTIAAQLDNNDNDLELAAGYTVYKITINNPTGLAGNSMVAHNITVDGQLRDGFTSISDIDLDGQLDIVVASSGTMITSRLYVYSLSNQNTQFIASVIPPVGGGAPNIGPPFIGDIDGSGRPHIGITRAYRLMTYFYNNTNTLQLKWLLNTNDESGQTGLTMFDFDQDGVQELIYRDETTLRLINGAGNIPVIMSSINCISPTGNELPIIGDIDGTGEAKICVTCGPSLNGRIVVYGAPADQQAWAPARGIWNQYNYHIFNIEDDLSVPMRQKNNATFSNGRFNNFLVQASLLDEEGNFLQPVPELYSTIDCINIDPVTREYIVSFTLYNATNASKIAPAGVQLAFFNGNPENSGTLIGLYSTQHQLEPGQNLTDLTFRFNIDDFPDIDELFLVVNTRGDFTGIPYTPGQYILGECDFTNNIIFSGPLPKLENQMTTICQGAVYDFYGEDIDTEGVFYHHIKNQLDCDSIVTILNIQFDPTDFIEFSHTSCEPYYWIGIWRDQTGVYTETLTNAYGCDSVVHLDLEILISHETTEEISSCTPYTWHVNGITYDQTGVYTEHFTNNMGCDSIVNLHLEINPADEYIETQSTCDQFFWPINNQIYNQSGIYKHTLTNQYGCDSTLILDLILNQSHLFEESHTSCGDFIWEKDGNTYDQSGTYLTQLQNEFGCDSIHVMHLEILQSTSEELFIESCGGFMWDVDGNYYHQSGEYSVILTNRAGCDSLVTLNLEINPSFFHPEIIRQCNAYLWEKTGEIYDKSGIYTLDLKSHKGCDSIFELMLTIDSNYIYYDTATAFDWYEWHVNLEKYLESGNYEELFSSIHNCDSIWMLYLEIIRRGRVFVPSAFTPGANGINDKVTVFASPEIEIIDRFQIYDRWGELMFERYFFPPNVLDYGWDGIFRGKLMNPAVFVYVMEWTDVDGQKKIQHGDITLIK
jgi:gliding motility-associated-like protein